MLSITLLGIFLLLGLITARRLFSMFSVQARIWLGLVTGLVEMMWLPTAYAFLFKFSLTAHYWALGTATVIALASLFVPAKRQSEDSVPVKLTLLLVLPLLVFSAYLQYTHTLMPTDYGLSVGQSTFGDLCLHLGIATGLRDASFPPEYTILPGTALGYPFLFDAISASMLLFGCDLAMSFIIPSVLAMGLVYWGFVMLAWEMTKERRAVAVAFLLAFINGGLGFLYVLDGVPSDWSRLYECLFGFYRAPANMPDLNLRWVNVICDLMIPQRTLLAGWAVVLPAVYMLLRAVKTNSRRLFITLGVWAGLMPMIHTHSFLALGLISFGCMISCAACEKNRRKYLINFLIYGCTAAVIASGQLFKWTFPQSLNSGQMKFYFNWVNNESGSLIDGYFWFWIKNVGPVYVLLLPAALNAPKKLKYMSWGCLTVYIAAECWQFQPNIYDNNKLFYVAYLVMLPLVGKLLVSIWDALKPIKLRGVLLAVFMALCLTSGGLSLAREAISNYGIFSKTEVEAANFVEDNLPKDCVILTGIQHNNAIAALTGRKIVCGTPSYLFYHGVDYSERESALKDMYENPAESWELFERYNVDYIYVSSYEQNDYNIDYETLLERCEIIYDDDFVRILKVPDETAIVSP